MDFEDLIREWFDFSWREALRRVTRCAGGDVHLAEEKLQEVLTGFWKNRDNRRYTTSGQPIPTNCERLHRYGDQVQIIGVLEGKLVLYPLTNRMVGLACRQLQNPRRRQNEPLFFPLPDNDLLAGRYSQTQDDCEAGFKMLQPCLDQLNANQKIAVVVWLEEACPHLQRCTMNYIARSLIEEWLENRISEEERSIRDQNRQSSTGQYQKNQEFRSATQRSDLLRGRRRLIQCLWQRNVVPCLKKLNTDETIAVVTWLEEEQPHFKPFTTKYVPRSLIEEWRQNRDGNARRSDLRRGRTKLIEFLWQGGWNVGEIC